ncbi:restriction endonuclease subunit S [Vibrio navarrensis]|uniref:restriction endonuclease subunit S n=1 Tax=Vibrio navarrensis TaxID=29495 RepID=UPI00186A4AA1|nr:restriction endonuclease subunit S [Vibrio navarrensis]
MGSNPVVTTKLSDLCELIVDCPHSTPKWTDSGFVVLRNQNIRNGALDLTSPSYTDEAGYNSRIKRAVPQAGDIVITREAPMGEVCIIPEGLQCCLGQRQVLLRPKKGISNEYLFWALQSPFVKHQISWNEGTGTTVSNIRIPVLKAFEIPRWFEQEPQIAAQLSAIDNKITLNRQINQTLEQMAQTLFKSWFVDFDPVMDNALDAGNPIPDELQHRAEARKAVRQGRAAADKEREGFKPQPDDVRQLFPDAFEESELGWVPKGWETKPISSLINLIGGGTPKTSEESYWGGEIPWFSVVDAPNDSNVFVLDTEKKVTEAGVANSSTKVLRVGTTIISARGTVGKCALVATPMAMNQSCYGVVGAEGVHDYFVYYLLRQSVKQLQQRSHGSVFSTITRDTFSSLKLATGNVSLTQLFGNTISPWFEKILANNQQQSSLERLRDTLLPKLISGELRLDDVEAAVEQETVSA